MEPGLLCSTPNGSSPNSEIPACGDPFIRGEKSLIYQWLIVA